MPPKHPSSSTNSPFSPSSSGAVSIVPYYAGSQLAAARCFLQVVCIFHSPCTFNWQTRKIKAAIKESQPGLWDSPTARPRHRPSSPTPSNPGLIRRLCRVDCRGPGGFWKPTVSCHCVHVMSTCVCSDTAKTTITTHVALWAPQRECVGCGMWGELQCSVADAKKKQKTNVGHPFEFIVAKCPL